MKLTIVMATRMRPGNVERTLKATLPNIKHPDTKIVVCIDDDDRGTASVVDTFKDEPRVEFLSAPREDSLGGKYNRGVKHRPADVYLAMTDYAPMVVPGFDERIIEAAQVYPDGYAAIVNHLVCTVDARQPGNWTFCQINAATHKLVEKMGGLYPEYFPYWFVDHWFEDLATMIGRKVFVDIVADGSRRPGTMDLREPAFWGSLFNWLHTERVRIADSIIDAPDFEASPAQKTALRRNYQLVIERSVKINEQLMALPPGDLEDERYLRLRQPAIELHEKLVKEYEAKMQAHIEAMKTPQGQAA